MRNIRFAIGEYYHLYDRGCDKRITFEDDQDYWRFILLLYLCNQKPRITLRDFMDIGLTYAEILELSREQPLVAIGAYCLMPNHFHIYIKELTENGISLFIQKVITGYTMYFNKKNDRNGSLFSGTFKAKLVDTNMYSQYLYSYIHLNPLKLMQPAWKEGDDFTHAEAFLIWYKYSSYHEYMTSEKRMQRDILSPQEFPQQQLSFDLLTEIP